MIPIVNVWLCRARRAGSPYRLGPVWLSRSRARRMMLLRSAAYSSHTDNFCLAGGWGIRSGYATPQLVRKLPGRPHAGGIVLALSANPHTRCPASLPGCGGAAASLG